jgi:hypothetical protein
VIDDETLSAPGFDDNGGSGSLQKNGSHSHQLEYGLIAFTGMPAGIRESIS